MSVVSLRNVIKDFQGLRPLRVREFDLHEGQSLGLVGVDEAMASVLINLITGSVLPDQGAVTAFGKPTSSIVDGDAWLTLLDDFGILGTRTVLLEQLTVRENLTIPLSMVVDQPPPDVAERVEHLAMEVQLAPDILDRPLGEMSPMVHAQVRAGKAVAPGPRVLLAEHPNALVEEADVPALADMLSQVVTRRRLTCLIMTADLQFARRVAGTVRKFEPATGDITAVKWWHRMRGR